MNVDGNFNFYSFIWGGVQDGWVLEDRGPLSGIKVIFEKAGRPSPREIKAIRSSWPRLREKSASKAKKILEGEDFFVFGKYLESDAKYILAVIRSLQVNAEIVDVPDYLIYNKGTREVAQIRSDEVFDQVTEKLIENGCEIEMFKGFHPGGIIIESE